MDITPLLDLCLERDASDLHLSVGRAPVLRDRNGLNAIEGVSCQLPRGAFYVFPNIRGLCERLGAFDAYRGLPEELRAKTTPSTLFQMFLLFHHPVATVDRRSFGRIGTEDMHFLRLSIATAKDDLIEAVRRIGQAADDRDGFAAFVAAGENLY